MLEKLLAIQAYHFAIVLFRITSAFMFMPGFAASYVNMRIRLLIGIMIAVAATPVLEGVLPQLSPNPSDFLLVIIKEITIGLFIGIIIQFIMAALSFAGSTISTAISLSQAQVFDPVSDNQSMIMESFLSVLALTMIFVTDMHHLMIDAIIESYYIFPPDLSLNIGDMGDFLSHILNKSFYIGFILASPFLVFALIVYSGMGLLSRFMPQMNVFFVMAPAQILFGFGIFLTTLSFMMMGFMKYFETTIIDLLQR